MSPTDGEYIYFEVFFQHIEVVKLISTGDYETDKKAAEKEALETAIQAEVRIGDMHIVEVEEIDADDYDGDEENDEEDENSSSSPVEADGSVGEDSEEEEASSLFTASLQVGPCEEPEDQDELERLHKPWEGEFPG